MSWNKFYFVSTYICKWKVFQNFKFINFSPKEKIRKDSWIKRHLANVSVKINRKTGRLCWKSCCLWWILKKAKLTNILWAYFFCIYFHECHLFLSLKESTCETSKNVFLFHFKISLFSRKSKLAILDIHILWHHQMPKTWNKEYILLNNSESKPSLLMKFGQFMS